jgi:hypothetical protein
MKPTFALDLTRDAIALLHRTPKGWTSIGEVAFDAPDLPEAMDYLRKAALGMSPMGLACKIILPSSQILYTEVAAPGPSRGDKRRQIAEALEGRTPYPVEDLVFDWSGKGATVKVAVVARETLAEAEGFAVTHRLNPVSFVAIPPDGAFVGEAWFGPTVASETLLAPGEVVDRDREAVTILQRELPVSAPAAAVVEPSLPQAEVEAAPATPAPPEDDFSALPGLEEALSVAPAIHDEPSPKPDTAREDPLMAAPDAAERALSLALGDVPVAPAETSPPDADPAPAPVGEPVEEAPFAHVTDASAFPDADEPALAGTDPGATVADDIPPAPSAAAIAAFASRRTGGDPGARTDGLAGATRKTDLRPGQPIPRPTLPKGPPGPVTAPTIPGTRAKPKGRVSGTEAAVASLGGGAGIVKSPARPGGTFGAASPPRNRTGVVFLVLVALLLLFLAIIAAWSTLWLSRNGTAQEDVGQVIDGAMPGVDDEMLADMQDPEGMTSPLPEADQTRPVDVGALATEGVPINMALEEPLPETGDGQAAPLAADDTASLAEDTAAADAVEDSETVAVVPPAEPAATPEAEPVAEPLAEAGATPEPAPGTAVATDLTAAQAPAEDQDEIFLAAMDAPPPALDALALPVPAAVSDTAPDAPMPPPAFGTVYRFDANGLVVPTPEGILSPDGVLLIAGRPPLVPPPRSDAATQAALAAAPVAPPEMVPGASAEPAGDASLVTEGEDPVAEPAPSDPAMAGFRPRARPDGLAPAPDDDAALPDAGTTEVVGLRPLARPASVMAAAAAARPAESETADLGAQGASLAAQAEAELAAAAALEAGNPSIVAISRRPEARPRDLSRAVEAAVAAAVRAPDPEPAPEAEAEVVTAAAAAAPAPALKPEELDEVDEPEPTKAAPKIPTKASVAKQATFKNAINLSKISLIGTYGTDSKRYALVRQANGRYKKVKVGDSIDGGKVQAITATEVRYQKGGKLVTLAMPKA